MTISFSVTNIQDRFQYTKIKYFLESLFLSILVDNGLLFEKELQ